MSECYPGRTEIRRTLLGVCLAVSSLLTAGCSVLGEDEPHNPSSGPSIAESHEKSTEISEAPQMPNRPKSAINTKVLGIFPGYVDLNSNTNPDVVNVFRGSLEVFENNKFTGVIRAGSAGELAVKGFLVRPLVVQGESGRLYLSYQTEGQVAAGEGEFIYIPITQKLNDTIEVALKSEVFGDNGTRLPPNVCPRAPLGTAASELGVDRLINPVITKDSTLYLQNQSVVAMSTEKLGDGYEAKAYELCPSGLFE